MLGTSDQSAPEMPMDILCCIMIYIHTSTEDAHPRSLKILLRSLTTSNDPILIRIFFDLTDLGSSGYLEHGYNVGLLVVSWFIILSNYG